MSFSIVVGRARNSGKDQTMARNRWTLNDAVISASALLILLIALVAIDDRVREQIAGRVHAGPTAQLNAVGSIARDVVQIVAVAAREQSIEHAPLMILVVAATVLVLFMLRM
jgi:hypothetical protein